MALPPAAASHPDAPHAPDLDPREKKEAEERTTVSASVIHEAVRKQAELELERPPSALAWSGLAAGREHADADHPAPGSWTRKRGRS